MIIVFVEDYNNFSQDYYNSVIDSLQLHQLTCTCGHSGCLCVHAYYSRSVFTPDGLVTIRICRVRCEFCGKTHALLLSSIVPYDRISLSDQYDIICAYEDGTDTDAVCDANNCIDENNVKSVILRYRRFWRQRLRSESIGLVPFASLVRGCLSVYCLQFMQIHPTPAMPFLNTT